MKFSKHVFKLKKIITQSLSQHKNYRIHKSELYAKSVSLGKLT